MISLLEVAERVQNGSKMNTMDYDMSLFRKVQELTARHKLNQSGKEEFWDVDNAYLDSIFQAGVDFLVENGVYCINTQRIVKFSEDEVRRAAREMPKEILVGEGADTRIIRKRGIEDHYNRPSIIVAGHSGWSDEVPVPIHIATREMTRDARVDAIQGFMYAATDGLEIAGEPLWAYGARRSVERVRDGITQAGRPGLCVIQYPTMTSAFAMIAAMDPRRGLRPSDGTLFSIQPDLHIEVNYIAASLVFEEYGLAYKENQGGGSNFTIDIYGNMIISVASRLAAWICYRDNIQGGGGTSEPVGYGTGRDWRRTQLTATSQAEGGKKYNTMWLNFATFKALHRHSNLITKANIWGCHEVAEEQMSEEFILREAISAMRETLFGNHFHFAGSANPPTVIRWAIDISDAVMRSKLKLSDYQELVKRIVREKLPSPEKFQPYDMRMKVYENPKHLLDPQLQVYDFFKQKISDEYLKNERNIRLYLQDLGLDFVA